MKFYTNKYPVITLWQWDKETNTNLPEEQIEAGTIFKITGIDQNGIVVTPISKNVKMGVINSFPFNVFEFAFTESEYTD